MKYQNLGFTLIELVVTVAMAAIVLTVGVPSFKEMTRNNRMTTATNLLVGAANLARSEAIKRGISATLCKRNSAGNDCDSSATWNDGWIVFADQDGDGNFEDDGDTTLCEPGEDCLLRLSPPLASSLSLTFPRNRITFSAAGYARGFNGTFTLCDDRTGNVGKSIILSPTGRIRIDTGVSCP